MDKDFCPYIPIEIDSSQQYRIFSLSGEVIETNKKSNVANAFCISIYCALEIIRHLICKGSLPNTKRNKKKCGLYTNGCYPGSQRCFKVFGDWNLCSLGHLVFEDISLRVKENKGCFYPIDF